MALKVCREDLTKAEVELNRLHAEYGDVVPLHVLGGSERWAELSQDQSSKRRLDILLAEHVGKISECFTGLGTSDAVPIYLRYEEQLKNHRLKKADMRNIKDVWKEKVIEDDMVDESIQWSDIYCLTF
ncbi:hypothetical protein J4Q44_G00115700 [Coregonus suidteri]|uniref:Uncharacterized protein n=1 Tax=Coregonus suidteri TaxID=861788 RepID=A0AAN8LYY3_9TELE